MDIQNKKIEEGQFLKLRQEVLQQWPTGKDVDLQEAVDYHKKLSADRVFSRKLLEAKKAGRTLIQPRAGVPVLEEHIRLMQYLEKEGEADLLPTTIDSYTRQNRYEEAENGVAESIRLGRAMLNGFPAVNHGVAGCRRVIESVHTPLQVRHGTPDARLLTEIAYAGGFTSYEGGGISYNLPYCKNVPMETTIRDWQYVDRLTGLYQSDAAQKQIAYCLSQLDEDSIPAVLLLNVDGFHHLNRRYGSLFGDAVLEELARALRRTFRRADVIARMGGDEFLIFLPSVSSAAVAGERAGRLLEACRRVMRSAGELTCRVGVALDWRRERSCDALLRDCGRALARAKSRGGDGYVIFSDETADAEPPELPASPEIEPGEDMAGALSRIVSDTLGGCGADPEQSVAQALERIGRLLSVSRVYIYEALDGGRCRASLAWNAEETAPLAGGWPEQGGAHIPGEFDERGMLRLWDPAEEPPERREWMERNGTLSALWCAVTEADRFLGFVGFDDCALRRIWRREQEETLAFAAKLLFSILNGGSCEPQDPAGGPRA